MSFIREIRTQIRSVGGTQKITRAMEMVAASKMRKAQAHRLASQAYVKRMQALMYEVVAACIDDAPHPYLQVRAAQRVGIILVSSDRGLCGGLNTNLFKFLVEQLQSFSKVSDAPAVSLGLVGHKATTFVKRLNCEVLAQVEHLGDTPQLQDFIGIIKVMLDRYRAAQLDRVLIASNSFVNTMTQKPRLLPLLPIVPSEASLIEPISRPTAYLYEPDKQALLSLLMTRYIESQTYQAVMENIACEQAARRVSMKNATENADELIGQLHRSYHKARQAAITRELAEIVSGAEAV